MRKAIVVFAFVSLAFYAVEGDSSARSCDDVGDVPAALGMESGAIADAQLSASSSFDAQSVGQQNARIRTERASGAWCPKQQIRNDSAEYIQVNLLRPYLIETVETQGRYGNGTGREFVEFYFIDYLKYYDSNNSSWIRYRNRTGDTLMNGNTDTVTTVWRSLEPPIIAATIRLVPYSTQTRTACLRFELYGCHFREQNLSSNARNQLPYDKNESQLSIADFLPYHIIIGGVAASLFAIMCLTMAAVRHRCGAKKTLKKSGNECFDGTKSAQDSFYSAAVRNAGVSLISDLPNVGENSKMTRANLVTALSADGTPTHLLQSFLASNLKLKDFYATVQPPKRNKNEIGKNESRSFKNANVRNICSNQILLHNAANFIPQSKHKTSYMALTSSGTLSSCCSVTDSLVSRYDATRRKNSAANDTIHSNSCATKETTVATPPSLLNFNFPPPPPSQTLSLSQKQACVNNQSSLLNAKKSNENHDDYCSVYSKPKKNATVLEDEEDNIYAEPANIVESISLLDVLDSKQQEQQNSENIIQRFPLLLPPPLPKRALRTSASTFCASASKSPSSIMSEENSSADATITRSASAQKSNSARSYHRPVPKPRSSATFERIGRSNEDANHWSSSTKLTKTSSPESGIGHDSRDSDSRCSNQNVCMEATTKEAEARTEFTMESLKLGKKLGGGKFTTIHLAIFDKFSPQKFALKALKSSLSGASLSAARQAISAELRMLSTIEHPNFVKFFGEIANYNILTEYSEIGDLRAALKSNVLRMSDELFADVCAQIVSAFAYLEARHLVHGHFSTQSCLLFYDAPSDDNILRKSDAISVVDEVFSESKRLRVRIASPRGANLHAQLRFSAPEAIICNEWTNRTDVWSFGISAWEILHNAQILPYNKLTNAQLFENAKRILNCSEDAIFLDFEELHVVSTNMPTKSSIDPVDSIMNRTRAILAKCWRAQSSKRPAFQELQDFFKKRQKELLTF